MAPTRTTKQASNALNFEKPHQPSIVSGKRKAELSPIKNDRIKRSALGNLTNALVTIESDETVKKNSSQGTDIKTEGTSKAFQCSKSDNRNAFKIQPISSRTRAAAKVQTRSTIKRGTKVTSDLLPPPQQQQSGINSKSKNAGNVTTVKSKNIIAVEAPIKATRRISNEFELTEESLYVSALEDIPSDISRLSSSDIHRTKIYSSASSENGSLGATASTSSQSSSDIAPSQSSEEEKINDEVFPTEERIVSRRMPLGVEDFDKENWNDPFQVSHYAMNIFEYLKNREADYKIKDYMCEQPELSKWMRSLLIDWMVEVQESFELNHETLYLAVKIVDTYLGKERVTKDLLQLLGAAALLIACKYDERTPPLIEDFLFICDGAYKRTQLLKMEITVFRSIGFDLAYPLSYRFLRRYARCGKISMVALTLARYILEYSLMEYSTIQLSDSKMACAALFMSLRMNGLEGWNATYEHFSGYKLIDFAPIVVLLNTLLHRKPKDTLSTVRNKYSHKIFHQVVNIPLLDINQLFEKFPDVAKKLSGLQLTYQSIIASCSSSSPAIGPNTQTKAKSPAAKKLKKMPLPLIG